MAQGLGLEVTAEGVEEPAAIEYLVAHGCDHAQGYAVSRPFPAEELLGWIGGGATGAVCSQAACAHVPEVFSTAASGGLAAPSSFSSAMIGAAARKQSMPTGMPQ